MAARLVASLAKPGGNITGLTIQAPELIGKRLQFLKEAIPRLSRVAVLWNAANPANARRPWREAQDAAWLLGLSLLSEEVRDRTDFDRVLAAMTRAHPDALLFREDSLTLQHARQIVEFVIRNRMPSIFGLADLAAAGGLMSYGPHAVDQWRRGAVLVDKILKGMKPADLPMEEPTEFELVINVKTAKALAITVPPSLLLRADQIIE